MINNSIIIHPRVFRCALPILNGGVSGMLVCGPDQLVITGGDGKVKRIKGADTHWDMECENILEAPCMSLTMSADSREVLVSTKNGKLWRLLTSDLTTTLHAASHVVGLLGDHFQGKRKEYAVRGNRRTVFLPPQPPNHDEQPQHRMMSSPQPPSALGTSTFCSTFFHHRSVSMNPDSSPVVHT